METDKLRTWARARLESNAPPQELQPGGVGQPIQELAAALHALEGHGSQLFGMNVDVAQLKALQELVPVARDLLLQWRARLTQSHGPQGTETVDTIAARHGVTLAEPPTAPPAAPPDAATTAVLGVLDRTLGRADALTRAWAKARDLAEEDDVVLVETGRPNVERIQKAAARHAQATGLALPPAYVALLCRHDGIAVTTGPGGAGNRRVVEPGTLEEPVVWPLATYGDHDLLADVDLPGVGRAWVLGELVDLGFLVLDLQDGPGHGAVFYVPRNLSSDKPVKLAAGVTPFLETWCASNLNIRRVLAKAGVPGFSG